MERPHFPEQAFIRFKNNTCFSVEIIWIIDDNKEKVYNVLDPQTFVDVDTFSLHSWTFRECASKIRMVVAGKDTFIPKPWIEEHRRLEFVHPINLPLRTKVIIEMPFLDLRQLCLIKLAYMLKSKNDLMQLELPRVLQEELAKMISNKD